MLRLKREEREKKYADQTDPGEFYISLKKSLICKALKIDRNQYSSGVKKHHFRLSKKQ